MRSITLHLQGRREGILVQPEGKFHWWVRSRGETHLVHVENITMFEKGGEERK